MKLFIVLLTGAFMLATGTSDVLPRKGESANGSKIGYGSDCF